MKEVRGGKGDAISFDLKTSQESWAGKKENEKKKERSKEQRAKTSKIGREILLRFPKTFIICNL